MPQVVQRNRQGYEWVSFVNPTPIQTIPSVRPYALPVHACYAFIAT